MIWNKIDATQNVLRWIEQSLTVLKEIIRIVKVYLIIPMSFEYFQLMKINFLA